MKDKASLHQNVQYLCDCFATADPLKEMSHLSDAADVEESAAKWIALAALHGINADAEKISLFRAKTGEIQVTARYRDATLPDPGQKIGGQIVQTVKEITHIHEKKGSSPLALGIRDSSIDLDIKVKSKEKGDTITINFPR